MRIQLNAFTASLALHLAAVIVLLARTTVSTPSVAVAPTVERTIKIEWHATLPAQSGVPSPPRRADARIDEALALDGEASQLDLGNFSFDLRPIVARARELFPFLTETIALEPTLAAMRDVRRGGLASPLPRAAQASDKPPLAMREAEIQRLIDDVFTRRARWERFQPIAALTNDFDPDQGHLPAVIRRYVDHNVLQPYVDTTTRDPRLWTMLGLAAEHTDFIAFITRYAAEHPSSKTTTELMFLLDDLAQGSRDTLLVLLDLDPNKHLWWTGLFNRDAQRFVAGLQGYYSLGLQKSPLQLRDAVKAHYDSVRIAILESILHATPGQYRATDARFLIGSIYWSQRRTSEAIDIWRQMSRDANDEYAAAASDMLDAVNTPRVSAEAITRILDAQRARYSDFWFTRLRRFGYRADTF